MDLSERDLFLTRTLPITLKFRNLEVRRDAKRQQSPALSVPAEFPKYELLSVKIGNSRDGEPEAVVSSVTPGSTTSGVVMVR